MVREAGCDGEGLAVDHRHADPRGGHRSLDNPCRRQAAQPDAEGSLPSCSSCVPALVRHGPISGHPVHRCLSDHRWRSRKLSLKGPRRQCRNCRRTSSRCIGIVSKQCTAETHRRRKNALGSGVWGPNHHRLKKLRTTGLQLHASEVLKNIELSGPLDVETWSES